MTPSIPIKLSGNLGERHRCLNGLVRDANQRNACFHSIQTSPDQSPADRLFKIDLASEQRNVDYIIQTLKDDDTLYVSRALKSSWLLEPEHSNIINPNWLEQEVFTQMTTQAVNKMKHWIQLNLRDPERCQKFYQFYKGGDFDMAVKFLWHCSTEFILREFSDILDKITPKHLKVLSEKVPQVTKIYFDKLRENEALLKYYLNNDFKFFANVKYLLKSDPDVFFYVLENFFIKTFRPFNSVTTKYIMRHHKSRFMAKPELYTAWFLNVAAVSKCLSSEEIKELVLKLAKAEYLGSWFSYKVVEPLIKRVSGRERAAFKKLVFVDKAFGPTVKEWPYSIPAPPVISVPQTALFRDVRPAGFMCPIYACRRRRCGGLIEVQCCASRAGKLPCRAKPVKTLLDQLFEKYRFSNFKRTLVELQRRLKAESSAQNRMYMLLVLVSKTGGKTEDLVSLLELLSQYKNEPVQIRAAIVRSLVKRAFVWRLAPEHWQMVLEWGHGLGLDGSPAEAACREGLHAVVARDLLAGVVPTDQVVKAFLADFSALNEYSFTFEERCCLRTRLLELLLAAVESDPDQALYRLPLLLDTLDAYHMRYNHFPGTVEAVAAVAQRDFESAKCLLERVYIAGVARDRLIRENFELIQTDASYVNALRHDVSILDDNVKFEELIDKGLKHEKFLRKLAIYFTEKDGLGQRYLAVLEARAAATPDVRLARPLALLAGSTFPSLLKKFDAAPRKTPQRHLAAALRSNAHVVRPVFDWESFGWRAAGAKAIANRVATCRQVDVDRYLRDALSWRRTLRIALVLAERVGKERDAFKVFASERPAAAVMATMRYFRRKGDNSDPRIWNIVKSHTGRLSNDQLSKILTSKSSNALIASCHGTRYLVEYYVLLYNTCKKKLYIKKRILLAILSLLPELDSEFIIDMINENMLAYFKENDTSQIGYHERHNIRIHIEIIVKFLLLSTSEDMLEERLRKVGGSCLKYIENMWKRVNNERESIFFDFFLQNLRYNKVYFDVKYVSCLTLFERLNQWMHSFLPSEKWFDKYATLHLTTIYFRTVRACLEQYPDLFSDDTKKIKEGPHILGTTFGKFVSTELEELTRKYFPSITELYGSGLVAYFNTYIYSGGYDTSTLEFTASAVKGLVTDIYVASCILAKYVFKAFRGRLKSEHTNDILKCFKESGIMELSVGLEDI